MSRTKDENDDLNEEIRECNNFAPTIAVDIHNNAGGGDGAECYYHHGGGTGKVLAENILAEIVKIGQNSRGAKTRKNSSGADYYGFIRMTNAPAVIVECAFVDNAKDIQIINTAEKQRAMGIALAKAILRTLGIEYKEEVISNTLYRVQVGAFRNEAYANAYLEKVKAAGFPDAFIVKSKGA
jgi:N-acetylmuramoyl-L-alanine amidase